MEFYIRIILIIPPEIECSLSSALRIIINTAIKIRLIRL